MSEAYQHENNLEKSIYLAKEALRLQNDKINKDYICIILRYIRIMNLCSDQKKKSVKEILKIVEEHDLSVSLKTFCHNIIGRYYEKENKFSNALYHYESSLEQQLKLIPPCYEDLISIYSDIGYIYQKMEQDDSDRALFYYEKSRDIYLELFDMDEIPPKDKKRMFHDEGYILENINQSLSLTLRMFLVYYSIADYYVKKENYQKALNYLEKLEQILNSYKGEKEIRMQNKRYALIGSVYESMQDYDQAIFCYEKSLKYILDDNNEYGLTFYLIGNVYRQKNDYLMSISKFKISLIFLHKSESVDHKILAQCYYCSVLSYKEIKNDKYAYTYSEQAIKHYLLCDRTDYDLAISSYVNCVDCLYTSRPWDYNKPLKHLVTALKSSEIHLKDSTLKSLYLALGFFYLLNEKYHNSLLYYNKILEYPSVSEYVISVYSQQWLNYMLMGQLDEAYANVKKRIIYQFNLKTVNFIDISDSYIDIGIVYHRLGKYKLSLKSYRTAFYILQIYQNDRTHINYSRIYNNIARIHLEYGQVLDARNLCLKARLLHFLDKNNQSSMINLYITLGLIECKLGNYYAALDYLGQAWETIFNENLHHHLSNRILYNHIGFVYYKLGQTQIAMKYYLKSLSLYNDYRKHPDVSQIYKNIGLIYEQYDENYPLALSFYKRALKRVPNNKHPNYILYKSMIITLTSKLKKKTERNNPFSRKFSKGQTCNLC